MKFSIRPFAITTIALGLLINGIIFFSLSNAFKENIIQLLQKNIQKDVLNIKHFIGKNITKKSIAIKTAHLDNFVLANDTFTDIHLTDENNHILYSLERNEKNPSNNNCVDISILKQVDVLKQPCYRTILIGYDDKKQLHRYNLTIFLDTHYLRSLVSHPVTEHLSLFLLFSLFFTILLWMTIKYILVVPLHKLLQYAYDGEHLPPKFRLYELEVLRISLKTTFTRLFHEQKELYTLSTKDPLSGLYNRTSLMEKIKWLIAQSKRNNEQFALIFFDLDNFKLINDTHGHDFGDKVLEYVSRNLLEISRENDIIARFGGDEFVILLPSIGDETKILDFLRRLKQVFSTPIEYQEHMFNVTASIGIVLYPKDGTDSKTLLKNADIAMYKAKDFGKNSYSFFTDALNRQLQEEAAIRELIEKALKYNYFQLYYQPKVDLKTNKIVGCEALVRLIDPEKGIISPDKFIPIAEKSPLIEPLSEFIIKEALRQLQIWSHTPLKDLTISINISGISFKDTDFIQMMTEHIAKSKPELLDIEITETILIQNIEEALAIIQKIKNMGVSFSLDDFGTGYSSLSYLKNIPFDTIKIDQSFTNNIVDDEKDRLFVKTIISITKNLNKKVVAEGVETNKQRQLLEEMECDIYQGYLCSKPVPAKEFEQLFHSHQCY